MRRLNEDQPPELHWNWSTLESAGACDVARLKQRLGAVIKAKCALDNKERREQVKQQKDERREAAGIRWGHRAAGSSSVYWGVFRPDSSSPH